jgi:hypothetical protein
MGVSRPDCPLSRPVNWKSASRSRNLEKSSSPTGAVIGSSCRPCGQTTEFCSCSWGMLELSSYLGSWSRARRWAAGLRLVNTLSRGSLRALISRTEWGEQQGHSRRSSEVAMAITDIAPMRKRQATILLSFKGRSENPEQVKSVVEVESEEEPGGVRQAWVVSTKLKSLRWRHRQGGCRKLRLVTATLPGLRSTAIWANNRGRGDDPQAKQKAAHMPR